MKITKTKIAQTLKESVFTPSKSGPMKVILDVGGTDYYIKRAIELLTVSLENEDEIRRTGELTLAISLLAVAKILIKEER